MSKLIRERSREQPSAIERALIDQMDVKARRTQHSEERYRTHLKRSKDGLNLHIHIGYLSQVAPSHPPI
jgi:hypothetical protein